MNEKKNSFPKPIPLIDTIESLNTESFPIHIKSTSFKKSDYNSIRYFLLQYRGNKSTFEADALETATVHWLRHTGISDDVNRRRRSMLHVRGDAGHASEIMALGNDENNTFK